MEPEYFDIERDLISEIERVKASGKRIVAVGTTTTRAIEGFISGKSNVTAQNGRLKGKTDIFIYPGYRFNMVDSIITNFHLPRSTPLMLASALCGWEKLRKSYEEAMRAKYRFFSYGDAMLIL
jgi:S-adenosylmethionine:tRNA ribosyltransferase-isomerase